MSSNFYLLKHNVKNYLSITNSTEDTLVNLLKDFLSLLWRCFSLSRSLLSFIYSLEWILEDWLIICAVLDYFLFTIIIKINATYAKKKVVIVVIKNSFLPFSRPFFGQNFYTLFVIIF